ncbi:MAG: NusA-like transcription termination signal-binding factor, partial [Candidatus Thermoplasmatota archaeon]|nr:NusA-like transcription termination signal-binding factor [Candidatus Thermoplasmatota archaeon]
MTDISLTNEAMKCIRMATEIAHVDIIDCMIEEDKIIFVVRRGQLGAAIGKNAKNLERLRNVFKKTIKFVEENPDKAQFIKNLCKPYTIQDVELSGSEEEPIA